MQKKYSTLICRWLAALLLFVGLAHCHAAVTTAAPFRLGWNAAIDPTVRGYALYYGIVGQVSMTRAVVGNNLTYTISNLVAGVAYRIYAVSYNILGVESIPSNELVFTPVAPITIPPPVSPVPSVPLLNIARQTDGSMKLSYKTTPGLVCGVQFSSTPNPLVWQTLTNVTADSISNVVAFDLTAGKVAARFYRVAHSSQPLVNGLQSERLPDYTMRVSFNAPPESICDISYASSALATKWRDLATVTADAEGHVTFIDVSAQSVGNRFYRVVTP